MDASSANLVVLGASSDIGRFLIREIAGRSGYRALAVSRQGQVKVFAGSGVERLAGIDLTEPAALEILGAAVGRFFEGKPFSVVHCVGDFWVHRPFVETPLPEVKRMILSHVFTLMAAMHGLTPLMKKAGGGRLVAFSCNSVGYSYPDMAPFTASKAAVESFVKCFANEHSEFGIAATALALPTIRTPKVEIEKSTGDLKNYLTPPELAQFILETVLKQPREVSGNVIKLFRHSRTFYHSSYYDRNPRHGA